MISDCRDVISRGHDADMAVGTFLMMAVTPVRTAANRIEAASERAAVAPGGPTGLETSLDTRDGLRRYDATSKIG